MPAQGSAQESWSTLDRPWRAALEMAWQSYRDGGISVGAVITDGTENILGRGRNQRFGSVSPRGLLVHAEVQALAVVPPVPSRGGSVARRVFPPPPTRPSSGSGICSPRSGEPGEQPERVVALHAS
ncbi:cytidine/deoxycytidylate deaminase family protein [Actinacidiphila soli]|uniref:hypothetical protein n=1 Tax=Actinacidiphila soli TaxID=2487275 RepID=UPI0019D0FA8C